MYFETYIHADPLDTWHKRNPASQSHLYDGIAYGNGAYVGILDARISISSDCINWRLIDTGTSEIITALSFRDSKFIAVGVRGTILTSADGEKWSLSETPTKNILNDVTFGEGLYVAVGDKGTILTSIDGNSWVQQSSATTDSLKGITFGKGTFVAVGDKGSLLFSFDGKSWSVARTGADNEFLEKVAFGNDLFVTVGAAGAIMISKNGSDWTPLQSGTSSWLKSVISVDGSFVAVGSEGSAITSSDGKSWSKLNVGVKEWLRGITFDKNRYMIYDQKNIYTSTDKKTWQPLIPGITTPLQSVIYSNDIFVSVGSRETILTSVDGVSWHIARHLTQEDDWLFDVGFGNGLFVAVGTGGTIFASNDGDRWTKVRGVQRKARSDQRYEILQTVAFGNGRYVSGGVVDGPSRKGILLISDNGIEWEKVTREDFNEIRKVFYVNNNFVGFGKDGLLLISQDGRKWDEVSLDKGLNFVDVIGGNNIFVAAGTYKSYFKGIIAISYDLKEWSLVEDSPAAIPSGIAFANGTFVLTTQGNTVYTSTDGKTWIKKNAGIMNGLNRITYGKGTFVAVGGNGLIIQSDGTQ